MVSRALLGGLAQFAAVKEILDGPGLRGVFVAASVAFTHDHTKHRRVGLRYLADQLSGG